MIGSVANRNLNSQGGSSRVCLNVIQVMKERGYSVKVLTRTPIDWNSLSLWHGMAVRSDKDISLEPIRFPFLGKYEKLLSMLRVKMNQTDLFFNTSADFFPFLYVPHVKNISYCHFPVVRPIRSDSIPKKYKRGFWRLYFEPYRILLNRVIEQATKNSLFLTNSEFSRRAILTHFGIQAKVIYPPVNVDKFQVNEGYQERRSIVVTISRFNPSKGLDMILDVLALLPDNIKWIIIGSANVDGMDYLRRLQNSSMSKGLANRLVLRPNASEDELKKTICSARVYFHPTRGEHFGISIVEAMAAGLIPVVWNFGGCTEFVPKELQFSNVEDAAKKVLAAMSISVSTGERENMKRIASSFSSNRFKKEIESIL